MIVDNNAETRKIRQLVAACPHCSKEFKLRFENKVELLSCDPVEMDYEVQFNEQQTKLLEIAENAGVLKAFQEVVEHRIIADKAHSVGNIRKFFLTVLRTAGRKAVPRDNLEELLNVFGRAETLEVWAGQGICIIVTAGRIRAFLPQDVISGQSVRQVGNGGIKARVLDENALIQWLRTKRGYVPDQCKVFMDVFRSTSFGPPQKVRLMS